MNQPKFDNEVFAIAEQFIAYTGRSIFLTGKAGTGKTTFLRHIRSTIKKNLAVVAPTGVAATHAGGTTIHSFFQLPFSPFVPEMQKTITDEGISTYYSLIRNLKIDADKRSLFQELELLIIDEVSMLRCDVLDAIDTVLKHYRQKQHLPFGGVQLLFIGDLYQLPPVVQDHEWKILNYYYQAPFFFNSRVIRQCNLLKIELTKIYRQQDSAFVALLNRIRNNDVDDHVLAQLNALYDPGREINGSDGEVMLTTHNAKADQINAEKLRQLPGREFVYAGTIEGNFSERNFPTDKTLVLKKGAQVMFLKNDMDKEKRYYNGKIGVVKALDAERILVEFPKEGVEVEVLKDTWKNIRYNFNSQTRGIEEEIVGTFTQFSIRLAWAVTIHKSQGLTFDKVIIDAEHAFAPGQVYVALSRCTSLHGIALKTRMNRSSIMVDPRVVAFTLEERGSSQLMEDLEQSRKEYVLNQILSAFDCTRMMTETKHALERVEEKRFKGKPELHEVLTHVHAEAVRLHDVAIRFQSHIRNIMSRNDGTLLVERTLASKKYFDETIRAGILVPLEDGIKKLQGYKRVKKYLRATRDVVSAVEKNNQAIANACEKLGAYAQQTGTIGIDQVQPK